MQHPFITDLKNKSMEELLKTIADLNQKLNFSYRTQNGALIKQLQMALESYNVEYKSRMDEIYKKNKLDNKINVSTDKQ